MELTYNKINVEIYTISFKNDLDTGEKELDLFRGLVKKLYEESKKAGFRNRYSVKEKDFIKELYTNSIGEDAGPDVQNLGSGLTYVPSSYD